GRWRRCCGLLRRERCAPGKGHQQDYKDLEASHANSSMSMSCPFTTTVGGLLSGNGNPLTLAGPATVSIAATAFLIERNTNEGPNPGAWNGEMPASGCRRRTNEERKLDRGAGALGLKRRRHRSHRPERGQGMERKSRSIGMCRDANGAGACRTLS